MINRILLVGCGHMGSALVDAWSRKTSFSISVVDPITYKFLKKKYGKKITFHKSINTVKMINKFNLIVFAVKPQIASQVISEYNTLTNKKILFLSIIAGKKMSFFEKNLGHPIQMIRAMPNMPALIEKGITCLISNKLTSNKNKIIANKLFKCVGKVLWLKKESDLDMVTAISGSGPAYYFLFIEHLIVEATKLGLKSHISKELIYQTASGSIELLLKNNNNARQLRKNIAVKGGTTEAAINVFQKKFVLKKIISKAINAAYQRSKILGRD